VESTEAKIADVEQAIVAKKSCRLRTAVDMLRSVIRVRDGSLVRTRQIAGRLAVSAADVGVHGGKNDG
jgi:hypothetical protein